MKSERERIVHVPGPKLRIKVCGSLEIEEYLWIGSRSASTITNILCDLGRSVDSNFQALDFACGCGRTLNFLAHGFAGKLSGSDYDPELVAWCNRYLSFAKVAVNDSLPRADFGDGSFDLIFAISFFTHLDEQAQLLWLQEFARMLRPGGILILSLNGPVDADRWGVAIPERGFLYFPSENNTFNQHKSYQTPAYIEREWTSKFSILDYYERGLNNHQDMVALLLGEQHERGGRISPPRLPQELLAVYETRPDLQAEFDQRGLGRKDGNWRNLSLLDWVLWQGWKEDDRIRHLGFSQQYQLKYTDVMEMIASKVRLPGRLSRSFH